MRGVSLKRHTFIYPDSVTSNTDPTSNNVVSDAKTVNKAISDLECAARGILSYTD